MKRVTGVGLATRRRALLRLREYYKRRKQFAPGTMRVRSPAYPELSGTIPATFMVIALRDLVVTHSGGKQLIEKVTIIAQDRDWSGPPVKEMNLSALVRWSKPL